MPYVLVRKGKLGDECMVFVYYMNRLVEKIKCEETPKLDFEIPKEMKKVVANMAKLLREEEEGRVYW